MLNVLQTDNKTFWKVVKPYFSNKSTRNEKMTLVEENKTIVTDTIVPDKLSSFYEFLFIYLFFIYT